MDVLVSCAETGDGCHTFNIFLFALVKTFKHEYTTKRIHIAGNISIQISVTFFFLTYRLICYLIIRPSDFARNVEFWLSYPVYSSSDTEKWNLCEKSHLCLRIAVSAYLNVGHFRLIRAPVVLTSVPIRERSCLLVEKRHNYIYSLEGVAALC